MGLIPHLPGREGSPDQGRVFSLREACKKAADVLKRGAISMKSFIDLYGQENVDRDEAAVRDFQEKFKNQDSPQEAEAKELATILEAVIHEQINKNGWLGLQAKAIRTSDFDDIINGVDSVVEFKKPGISTTHLALGVDVTYKSNLNKKFERIKKEIDNGELATVKYLKTPDFRGEKRNIPRLVLAVDGQSCNSLARTWYQNSQNAQGLKNNPIRLQILTEMIMQLKAFSRYAEKKGMGLLMEKYNESLAILKPISLEAQKLTANYKHDVSDNSLKEMEEELTALFE